MELVLLQAPAESAISVEEAQLQVRSTDPADVPLLKQQIGGATTHVEAMTGRRFVSQKWKQLLDCFPTDCDRQAIRVAYPELISVESVKYLDAGGTLQTLVANTDYVVLQGRPGRIVAAYGKAWPTTRSFPQAVRIEFTCGYGAASAVPDGLKNAIKLVVGTLYAHRETVVTGTIATALPQNVEWLVGPFKIPRKLRAA